MRRIHHLRKQFAQEKSDQRYIWGASIAVSVCENEHRCANTHHGKRERQLAKIDDSLSICSQTAALPSHFLLREIMLNFNSFNCTLFIFFKCDLIFGNY